MSTMVQAEISDLLWQQAHQLIEQGWANDMQNLLNEALRRYVESHPNVLNERFIYEDVEWGLHGCD